MRALFTIMVCFFLNPLMSQVVINEVMYENYTGIKDHWGKTSDWIELYNSGHEPQNLHGWGLTDKSEDHYKWTFPDTEIQPHEYKLIFASGNEWFTDTLHANFKLKQVNEPLILTKANGTIADSFPAQCVPSDKSAARVYDGFGEWMITSTPSPGASNIYSVRYKLNYAPDTLIASKEIGFYNQAFMFDLSNSIAGNTVFYTLDCREPDERSLLFESPIEIKDRSDDPNYFSEIETSDNYIKPEEKIFKATVIRAVVYSDGCPASEIRNLTFFVHPLMDKRYTVPVISIIAEPDDFFSDEEGIYVRGNNNNFLGKGKEWERPVHLQIFETTGENIIDQQAGTRIHGRGTRMSAQKSLRLYADEEYGTESFNYHFFNDREMDTYNSLLLRTTRGDWSNTLFTDILSHELVKDMNIDYMSGITAIVFINGEYWGIQNLREQQDEDYIKAHFKTSDSSYDIVDYVQGKGPVIESGSIDAYEELIDILYDETLDQDAFFNLISQKIDIQGMIDFFIAEMYLGNIDFPENNHTLWRPDSEGGKWRWFFYDCDACFYRYNYNPVFDYINELDEFQRYPDWSLIILKRLLENKEFRNQFTQHFYQSVNTVFTPERVISKIDSFKLVYQPLMAEHIERWREPEDITSWLNNIEKLKQFAIGRQLEITRQLVKYFGNPVLVYPNPAVNYITLESELFSKDESKIRIYDLTGKIVSDFNFGPTDEAIHLELDSYIPKGLYILNINAGYFFQSQLLTIIHE
jgi:hypothetical protein